MSRETVTLELVKEAKDALEAREVYPSVQKVRDHLGRGSPNTILKYLRELKGRDAGLFGDLGLVSQELAGLVLQLHNLLHKEAQATVEAAVGKNTKEYEEKLGEAQKRTEAAEREAAVERSAKDDLQARLKLSEELAADLNGKYNAASSEVARLSEALTGAQAAGREQGVRIQTLERNLTHEREGREHYEQAVAQERTRMQDAHAKETLAAHESRREQEDQITILNTQISDLALKAVRLDTDVSARDSEIARLTSAAEKSDERFEQQEAQVDELRIAIAGHEARAQILSSQHDQMTERLELKVADLVRAQGDIEYLTDQLNKANASLEKAVAARETPSTEVGTVNNPAAEE